MNPTTGVVWDLHTCPVPDDVDPRRVRACIESALEKQFGGPRPVTVFAVGNLDYVSPSLLEEISSSGVFLRHAPFRVFAVTDILYKWRRRCDGPMTHVLLISSDDAWYNKSLYFMGFTILRAFSPPRPPLNPNPNPNPHAKEWLWESIFKEYSGALHTSSSEVIFKDEPACLCSLCKFKDEPACLCTLCNFSSQSCDGFIEHLETTEHQERAFKMYRRKYVPANPSYEPVLICKVCKYTGQYRRHMATHYRSEEHSQKVGILAHPSLLQLVRNFFFKRTLAIQTPEEEACAAVRRSPWRITESNKSCKVEGVQEISSLSRSLSARRLIPCQIAGDCIMNPTTGVLWDLHTCPVPDDVDPRRVRACIESALEKHFGGPHPVTVFAVGNLDYVSPGLLEKISSSGVFLRHAPFRERSVVPILQKWKCDQRHTHILLISDDRGWFTTLSAFSPPGPPLHPSYTRTVKSVWESLLREYSGAPHTSSNEVIFKDEPACLCSLCDFSSQSCDGFIEHLKTTQHQDKAFLMYSHKYAPVNPSYKPVLFCQVCKYTGHHPRDMATHYRSEEHSQKKLAIQTLEEEEDG